LRQKHTQVDQTRLQKHLAIHSQDRKPDGLTYGGYLMKEAFELGWMAAFMHCGELPEVLTIADFQFLNLIDFGGCLQFEAKVGFTAENLVQVNIGCSELLPNKEAVLTNEMNVTYYIKKGLIAKPVVPVTYEESMIYIDSKRRVAQLLK